MIDGSEAYFQIILSLDSAIDAWSIESTEVTQ